MKTMNVILSIILGATLAHAGISIGHFAIILACVLIMQFNEEEILEKE
jgi:hypothetical protein